MSVCFGDDRALFLSIRIQVNVKNGPHPIRLLPAPIGGDKTLNRISPLRAPILI